MIPIRFESVQTRFTFGINIIPLKEFAKLVQHHSVINPLGFELKHKIIIYPLNEHD